MARKNSLNILTTELQQEIIGYDRLQEVMSALDVTVSKAIMQLGNR